MFMHRARHAFVATIVGAITVSGLALGAQTPSPATPPPAPELKSVLAGKKFTPPVQGTADIDFVRGATKREGSTLVTKIVVKNTSKGPIPRLTIDETWYDKGNNIIPGGKGVIPGLLQPDEVKTIEIRTAVNPAMQASKLMFSHANGSVNPHPVKSLDAPGTEKEPATKTASTAKKPAKK